MAFRKPCAATRRPQSSACAARMLEQGIQILTRHGMDGHRTVGRHPVGRFFWKGLFRSSRIWSWGTAFIASVGRGARRRAAPSSPSLDGLTRRHWTGCLRPGAPRCPGRIAPNYRMCVFVRSFFFCFLWRVSSAELEFGPSRIPRGCGSLDRNPWDSRILTLKFESLRRNCASTERTRSSPGSASPSCPGQLPEPGVHAQPNILSRLS